MRGIFSFISETKEGLMNMSVLKNYLLSNDLPAMHWVGKVSFGKLMSEKFRISAAPKVQKVNPFL